MNKVLKIAFSVFFAFILFATSNLAIASEGIIELNSTTGEPYRCHLTSIRMQDGQFRIPFSCRNLVYPAGENIFSYVTWAQPVDGRNIIKLGILGLGKGIFTTRRAFTSVFVTTESNRDVRSPEGQRVMQGVVEPILFLEEAPTPTPVPSDEQAEESTEEITKEEGTEEETQEELTTREKLLIALRRAGLAALFALVALIGLIFVVTRSRG